LFKKAFIGLFVLAIMFRNSIEDKMIGSETEYGLTIYDEMTLYYLDNWEDILERITRKRLSWFLIF